MEWYWYATVIIIVVALLLAILPLIRDSQPGQPPSNHGAPRKEAAAPLPPDTSKEMLASHYVPARATIPEDYPRAAIGSCPHSKPFSSDLPLADMPMCMMQSSDDMRLHAKK